MGHTLVTGPVALPITLTEAKEQCRVLHSDDDDFIGDLIAAATQHVEKQTGRAIMPQTWKLTLDTFSDSMRLPLSPVEAVNSVKYYDENGALQTLSASLYTADLASEPGRVVRNSDATWPAVKDRVNAVEIEYEAGYSSVPDPIKRAMLLLIGHWYQNREAAGGQMMEMPFAVSALLVNYRAYGFVA